MYHTSVHFDTAVDHSHLSGCVSPPQFMSWLLKVPATCGGWLGEGGGLLLVGCLRSQRHVNIFQGEEGWGGGQGGRGVAVEVLFHASNGHRTIPLGC